MVTMHRRWQYERNTPLQLINPPLQLMFPQSVLGLADL